MLETRVDPPPDRDQAPLLPGVAVTAVAVGAAVLLHRRLVPQVGVLTWAVLIGAAAANLRLLPAAARPGITRSTKRLLRCGVVLLGFSLSVVSIAALGAALIGWVVLTVAATFAGTVWLGSRMGLGRPRSLLIATGFAICGASAIAAMEDNAEADADDVAASIAMVTLCGALAMTAIPVLQAPLGLSDAQLGAWAGAAVHEVGQVVAAASPAGAAAVGIAVVVKLTRVLLLAPLVAGVSLARRRRAPARARRGRAAPPLVPLFVLGFLACVALRSTGLVPAPALTVISWVQTGTLAAALFGLGTSVHLPTLARTGGPVLGLGLVSTAVIAAVSLAGVVAIG